MSDKNEHLNNAERVIREATEPVVHELGLKAVGLAESATEWAAVDAPKALVKEAESITAYQAEVNDTGEDVQPHEELDDTVARSAARLLEVEDTARDARSTNKNMASMSQAEATLQFRLSKAVTAAEAAQIRSEFER